MCTCLRIKARFHASQSSTGSPRQWFMLFTRQRFFSWVYIWAERSAVEYRHLICCARSSKYCFLWWQTLGKVDLFWRRVFSWRWIYSGLGKLGVEMRISTEKYSSFNEQRYAWCEWIVYNFHNYNTRYEDKLERLLFWLGEGNFAPTSKVARYKQRNTVNFIEFYWFSVITKALATYSVQCYLNFYSAFYHTCVITNSTYALTCKMQTADYCCHYANERVTATVPFF